MQGLCSHRLGLPPLSARRRRSPARRFALPGYPKRAVSWARQRRSRPHRNFAVPPGGELGGRRGRLGLAVWERDGKLRWARTWWKPTPQREALLAPDNATLVTLDWHDGDGLWRADGTRLWQHTFRNREILQDGVASHDGSATLAIRSAPPKGGGSTWCATVNC